MSAAHLAVVIPVHNEAGGIGHLVKAVEAAMAENGAESWEIVVVDDCSTDSSQKILGKLQRSVPSLRVVRHERQLGQSAALVTGVRAASASWVVTLDGDGQNDPLDIGPIWSFAQAAAANSPVLVIGSRLRRQDRRGRRIVSWLIAHWSALALGHRLVDQSCGIKCFRREDFLELPPFNHMHRFLPGMYASLEAQILSFPVRHHPRTHGSSHYTNFKRVREAAVDVIGVLWLRRRLMRFRGGAV